MNFIEEFKKGQTGGNKGLYMGDGVKALNNALNGLQKGRILGIAAAPKVGKSTLADYACLINPYLYAREHGVPVEFVYFSFELDRVSKEFDFAAHFLWRYHGVEVVPLPKGMEKGGKREIQLSPDYLRGRVVDDGGDTIRLDPDLLPLLKRVYSEQIVPLFGKHNSLGQLVEPGAITFVETRNNPTGLFNMLLEKAKREGQFLRNGGEYNGRATGYVPHDYEKYTVIITDHLRKLPPEKGYTVKQTIDKYIEYSVELRNLCGYTFVHIIHLNRNMTESSRLKMFDDQLYPNSDDIKDSGNLAEEADYMLTMFNPNDGRYNLTRFFGRDIRRKNGDEIYPNLRSIHLVESRHCQYPQHFAVGMNGNVKNFSTISFTDK